MDQNDLLMHFREHELFQALSMIKFEDGADLLEIGGGNGFQAQRLMTLGFRVKSIDVCRWTHGEMLFPVDMYDGVNIPFPDSSFDILFSSNVLEHVKCLVPLLSEMKRVLRPGGVAVHVLPSVSWRFWSIFSHYWFVVRRTIGQINSNNGAYSLEANKMTLGRRGLFWMIKNALIPPAHGEFDSCLAELIEYASFSWVNRFAKCGWNTIDIKDSRLFYTDKLIACSLGLGPRIALSRLFGSACNIYILRKDL